MGDYLFNQNALILCSVISSIFVFLVVRQSLRLGYGIKRLGLGIAIAAGILLAQLVLVARMFGLQDTPAAAYYITFVCDVLLIAIVANWKKARRVSILSILALVSTLVLLGLTVNNFYQYYPTLGSIFIKSDPRQNIVSTLSTSRQHKISSNSIEAALFGGQKKGGVTAVNIPGDVSHMVTRNGYIYLPPAYSNPTFSTVRFPVLVLLTGTPGDPASWLQGGRLEDTMDNFASHHEGITPIVVVADHSGSFTNDTECLDSAQGNAETYLTVDVPSYMKQHYRVSSNPKNWGIAGVSEGGMCAAMLTLEHQDVFRHFLDMSGYPAPYLDNTSQTLPVLFKGSVRSQKEHNINWLIQNVPYSPGLTAQFAIGTDDNKRLISEMQQTYRIAVREKLPSTFELIGHQGHSFAAWSRAFTNALPALSYDLGATDCVTNCSQ